MAHLTVRYDPPPYYYTKLHPTTPGGIYLPVVRISRSGGGYPSIYVRVQNPGDYSYPVGYGDVEQLYVARIDYATVARAFNTSQAQFIRPFYPPPNHPGVQTVDLGAPLSPAGISYIPHAPSTSIPSTGPASTPPRPIIPRKSMGQLRDTITLDEFDSLHGVPILDVHGELLAPASPVLSDITSSSGSSSINLSRSALNHYISPVRSHRTGSSVSSRRSQSPVMEGVRRPVDIQQRMSSSPPSTGYLPPQRTDPQMDGLIHHPTELVGYQDSGTSSYSSYDLYNPGTSPNGASLRRKASRGYVGGGVMAYGAGLGMNGPAVLVGGDERGSRRWWK